ncbi:RNA 2',3'-cyclic phosphodiesterase [Planctobacterium marinum]|uniref:RNA 2',3'-cyclic phosphodiesterase n=1 Tax=Planctobacterium marinum TaxID=1631968 RepID=UPI001E561C0B|nr:RNA 2',3'-cyclic phosphodiesterase [Planctobacterium marinum]MCC2605005.1 RNA 2',3'-cyclic phosphodiesterase [Planctobacterium marinum]
MRTFIGLEPDADTKLAIANWRELAFPSLQGAIPMENFHITLAFLGDITPAQQEILFALKSLAQPLHLYAEEVGYFAKPGIGFLTIKQDEKLLLLQQKLSQQLQHIGRFKRSQKFIPHISLSRQTLTPLPSPLLAPRFELQLNGYHLYESLRHKNRVSYRIIHSWNRI